MLIVILLVALVAGLLFWGISIFNQLTSKKILVQEGWSGIGAGLQQRNDLIPNLVETVKGYATHEKDTLTEVIKWRNQSVQAKTPAEQEVAQQGLDKAMVNVLALTEQYPDLKSDAGFRQLQSDLKDIEEKINLARRYYNGTVRQFNTAIAIFPNSLIAGIGSFTPSPFFMEDPAAQQVPKVSFK